MPMLKLKNITAMLIFGTIPLFVANIGLPSAVIVLSRALTGAVFIAFVMAVSRKKPDWKAIKKNALLLLISGAAMGFNWILIFEAYKYTTVTIATLCNYMAPVFVILLSPFILKEKLTFFKAGCAAAAVLGTVLISGTRTGGGVNLTGITFGLIAAFLYCGVVLINKFLKNITPLDSTLVQLTAAGAVMIPYVLLTVDRGAMHTDTLSVVLLIIVGVVHTGFAYILYFSSVQALPVQTTAIFSYIEPVTAIVLSTLILSQPITSVQICGTVLILGATLLSSVYKGRGTAVKRKLEVKQG